MLCAGSLALLTFRISALFSSTSHAVFYPLLVFSLSTCSPLHCMTHVQGDYSKCEQENRKVCIWMQWSTVCGPCCAVVMARDVKQQSRATSWLCSSTKRLHMHLTVVLFSPPTCTPTALHFYDEVNTFAPMRLLVSSILTCYNYIYFD